jgi:hypothetical protein
MYSLDFRFSTTKMDLNYLSFYGHQEVWAYNIKCFRKTFLPL